METKTTPEKEPRVLDCTLDNSIEDIAVALNHYEVDHVWCTPKQIRQAALEINSLRRTIAKLAAKVV